MRWQLPGMLTHLSPGAGTGGGYKTQNGLTALLRGKPDAPSVALVREGLESAARAAETLVLSGETLHMVQPGDLIRLLRSCGWDGPARVVAVVRDAPSWLNSDYAHDAINLRRTLPFAASVTWRLMAGAAEWDRVLRPWFESPVEFVVVPYAHRSDGRALTMRVFEAMGIAAFHPGPSRPLLSAVDPRTVEAGRRLAQRGLRRTPIAIRRFAKSVLVAEAEKRGWDGRFAGLDRRLVRGIERLCAGSQDRLAYTAWAKAWHEVYRDAIAAHDTPNGWSSSAKDARSDADVEAVVDHVAGRVARRYGRS